MAQNEGMPMAADTGAHDFDPVCGMEFLPDHVHHVPSIELDGKVFHFCSDDCRRKFEAEPDRFVLGRIGQIKELSAEKPILSDVDDLRSGVVSSGRGPGTERVDGGHESSGSA